MTYKAILAKKAMHRKLLAKSTMQSHFKCRKIFTKRIHPIEEMQKTRFRVE